MSIAMLCLFTDIVVSMIQLVLCTVTQQRSGFVMDEETHLAGKENLKQMTITSS